MGDEIIIGFPEREKKQRIDPSWLKEQLLAGASVAQIARESGYSRQAVYDCIKRWGLKVQKRTDIDSQWLREQKGLGRSDKEIAQELGVNQLIVGKARLKHDIPRNHVDIDPSWLAEQKKLGRSDRKIAEEIGCSLGTIQNKRRKFGIGKNFPKGHH